jgi:hypothetical protein
VKRSADFLSIGNNSFKPGDKLDVTLVRDGKEQKVQVVLE